MIRSQALQRPAARPWAGRPGAAGHGGGGARRGAAAGPCRAATTDSEFDQLMQRDAFAELVRLAVEKDPSLSERATRSLGGNSTSASRQPQPLPNQTKPYWLRQRAPQGDRFEYLNGQMQVGGVCGC